MRSPQLCVLCGALLQSAVLRSVAGTLRGDTADAACVLEESEDEVSCLQVPRRQGPPTTKQTRKTISALSESEKEQLVEALYRMKRTPSPWASGTYMGQAVPKRWHNLTWYDTLVMIHTTAPPENPFAHMSTGFPGWHRVFLEILERGMKEVMGSDMSMPYWNWNSPSETEKLWEWIGGDGDPARWNCLTTGPFAWPKWNLTHKVLGLVEPGMQSQCLSRAFGTWGINIVDIVDTGRLPPSADVDQCLQVPHFDSWPFDGSAIGSLSFRNCIEGYTDAKNTGQTSMRGQHPAHKIHNIVHLFMGEAMAQISAPNDPAFFFHHSNIDRMYETWLEVNDAVPGSVGFDAYPARVKKVFGPGSDCPDERVAVYIRMCDEEPSMCIQVGNGSSQDWMTFVKCAYFLNHEQGNQVASDKTYGKRILFAFPEGSPQAAYIPPPQSKYADNYVFRASVGGNSLVYEEVVIGAESGRTMLPNPTIYNRGLLIHLRTPDWFDGSGAYPVVFDCKLYSAFGPIDRKCSEFKALATNINGTQKLDLDGFGPLHYYMPGYFDAIKGKLVAIDKSGSASTPFSTCAGGPYGCRMTNSENLTIHAQQQSAWEGEEMKWDDPLSVGLAYALLDSYECMSAEELVRNGYVKPDQESIASSARMTPSAAKFCVISGVYYLTDSTSDDTINITLGSVDKSGGRGHNNYLPADRAASLFMGPQLSVYNSQGEARFAGQQLVDVSDFVYSGAHPGHNAEDIMYPFDELGYSVSPADRFEPQPGLYDELMDTGR